MKEKLRGQTVERGLHIVRSTEAIDNTAQRLGVDPVAFAEWLQDGITLNEVLQDAAINRVSIRRKLAALKRAQPEEGSETGLPGNQLITDAGD